MSRKALPPADFDTARVIDHKPAEVAATQQQMREVQEQVLVQYNDGAPYVREVCIAEIRRDMGRVLEAIVSAGRRLIVMKEHERHGEWLRCLAEIGLEQRVAQYLMLAARKCATLPGPDGAQRLLEAAGSKKKLFSILVLPQEELNELVEGGALANGTTLDDIATMTSNELRAELRDLREQVATKDERARTREAEIERLKTEQRKLTKRYRGTAPAERTVELRRHLDGLAISLRAQMVVAGPEDDPMDSVRRRADELLAHGREHGDDQRAYVAGVIGDLRAALDQLAAEYDLPVTTSAMEPEWMREARAAGELPG